VEQVNTYDFIIAGAGCAGLSLLYHILQEPNLCSKKILVIDQNLKKSNDRTWCFWENKEGPFESLVCKKWDTISIHNNNFNKELATGAYEYKMIQGIDFYNYVINEAKQFSNITWQEVRISEIDQIASIGVVHWENGCAHSPFIFSSILPMGTLYKLSQGNLEVPFLWQHFKGRLVEYESSVFKSNVARLMDFNVSQHGYTGFMYILPLTEKKALVEYTLFSPKLLEENKYDKEIDEYLSAAYKDKNYTISHTEMGAIPMTQHMFDKSKAPIYVIGTLGNAVKASTGYAFHFIQEQTQQIASQLALAKHINTEVHTTRHSFYDGILLYILQHKRMEGKDIFARIFKKNEAATIFKFLSNTSTFLEDIKIMRSLPTSIFLPAAIKLLLRRR